MSCGNLIQRVRSFGAAGIRAEDRLAFAYRPGAGRVLRRELADELLNDYSVADLPLLRELITQETAARDEHDGCGRVLFALSMMLYAVGHIEDILLLHDAKYCNMDAGMMIDSFMLTMRQDRAVAREFILKLPAANPEFEWPREEVLSRVERAFDLAATGHNAADCLTKAKHELDAVYAVDLFDEDSAD